MSFSQSSFRWTHTSATYHVLVYTVRCRRWTQGGPAYAEGGVWGTSEGMSDLLQSYRERGSQEGETLQGGNHKSEWRSAMSSETAPPLWRGQSASSQAQTQPGQLSEQAKKLVGRTTNCTSVPHLLSPQLSSQASSFRTEKQGQKMGRQTHTASHFFLSCSEQCDLMTPDRTHKQISKRENNLWTN